jgi:hypothetical protein
MGRRVSSVLGGMLYRRRDGGGWAMLEFVVAVQCCAVQGAGKPLVFQDGLGQQSASFGAIAVACVDKRAKRSVTVGCTRRCEW